MNYDWMNPREPERMVGSERTRAYRYGMTLLCVGALFNWLGFSNSQSDPVRFIGYTCLASGALLLVMAICFWANSVQRPSNNQIRPESNEFAGVNIIGSQEDAYTAEKPPDYNSVADLSPPPCYDDAIRLSPAYLPSQMGQSSGLGQIAVEEPLTIAQPVPTNTPTGVPAPAQQTAEQIQEEPSKTSQAPDSPSTLKRVIRLSSRLLKRTLSNVDGQSAATTTGQTPSPSNGSVQQFRTDQIAKNTGQSSVTNLV